MGQRGIAARAPGEGDLTDDDADDDAEIDPGQGFGPNFAKLNLENRNGQSWCQATVSRAISTNPASARVGAVSRWRMK